LGGIDHLLAGVYGQLMRVALGAVLIALVWAVPAQARYLHRADALRVVTHEQQKDVRAGLQDAFQVISAERINAHGFRVTVSLVSPSLDDPYDRADLATWLEHVRLWPDGTITSHMDSFDYLYRERPRTGRRDSAA